MPGLVLMTVVPFQNEWPKSNEPDEVESDLSSDDSQRPRKSSRGNSTLGAKL